MTTTADILKQAGQTALLAGEEDKGVIWEFAYDTWSLDDSEDVSPITLEALEADFNKAVRLAAFVGVSLAHFCAGIIDLSAAE